MKFLLERLNIVQSSLVYSLKRGIQSNKLLLCNVFDPLHADCGYSVIRSRYGDIDCNNIELLPWETTLLDAFQGQSQGQSESSSNRPHSKVLEHLDQKLKDSSQDLSLLFDRKKLFGDRTSSTKQILHDNLHLNMKGNDRHDDS